ncbi:hypothetical protein BOX15_Mlig026417g1, partial [Macrostomum lignano]
MPLAGCVPMTLNLRQGAHNPPASKKKKKLLDLGWELVPHPPYSPDLAPSDYHLFLSLANALNNKTFADDEEL